MSTTFTPDGTLVIACDGSAWLGSFAHILRVACDDMLAEGPLPIVVHDGDGGQLRGTLDRVEDDHLLIDAGGSTLVRVPVADVVAAELG